MHERRVVGGLTEAQSRLPRFPDGATPDGPRIRDVVTRAVAVLALTATAVYLGWRAAFAAAGWLAFNLALVAAAIARIRAIRYGAERRASVRFPVSLPARLDGVSCMATDLSLTGARLSAPSPLPQQPSTLVVEAPGRDVVLGCAVRARLDQPDGGQSVAVEFQPGQWPAIGVLTHLLFNAGVGLDVVPEPVPIGAVA